MITSKRQKSKYQLVIAEPLNEELVNEIENGTIRDIKT